MKIKSGDRFYVYRINTHKTKYKCVAKEIVGDMIICEDNWFWDIKWCKPLITLTSLVTVK